MGHNPRGIGLCVVHHGANRPEWTWRTVHAMHLAKFKMFSGYHRIMERDGFVMDGRRIQFRGAHAPPNSNRLGLLVLGWNEDLAHRDMSNSARNADWHIHWGWTEAQWASLIGTELPYWCERLPDMLICGHNQTKATLCPGIDDFPRALLDRGWPHEERLLMGRVF